MASIFSGTRGVVIAFFAAGAILYAISGSTTPTPRSAEAAQTPDTITAQSSDVHKEGDPVLVGYTGYGVWSSWWSSRLTTNRFLNQPPNAKYLFVTLSVVNNDNKPRDIPPFKLVDDQGAEYEADANGYMLPGSIGLIESLNPSVSKLGFVVFDVPPDKHYRLKLSGGFWSNESTFVSLEPTPTIPKRPLEKFERLIAKRDSAKTGSAK